MLGYFGQIAFQVSDKKVLTFNGLTIESAAKFAEHALINQKPKLEYVGNELDTISFRIHLNAGLGVKPSNEIEKLKKMVDKGTAESLVIGEKVIGDDQWVIESISQAWNTVFKGGKLYSADVDITLKEYIDETINQTKAPKPSEPFVVAPIPQTTPASTTTTSATTSTTEYQSLDEIPGLMIM